MNMPLLDIQPRTLKFFVDLKNQTSCVVQLTNTTNNFVAFKVKTTSPKKYCVRPNVGVVEPKSSCEFTVIMQAFKEPPPDMVCKDKFLIQSIVVPAETTDEDITASTFSKAEGKYIEENKLRVTLMLPSNSPELSPTNGTLKQEAVFEDSIRKEPRIVGHDELELEPAKRGFVEDFDPANDLKKGMDLPGDQGFTNGRSSEPKKLKDKDVSQLQKTDEIKLVKDIEEMKLKVNALESKLKQADSTISKLMEERSISSQHRQSLQQELVELRTKKIVKQVHTGFPLMFVCVVAFICIVVGYGLRTR